MRRLLIILVVTVLCSACGVRRARARMEKGDFDGARGLLETQIRQSPKDVDARMLLAEVELRDNRYGFAEAALEPVMGKPDMPMKVSQFYREMVHKLEATATASTVAAAASEAVRLNPLAGTDMCSVLIPRLRRERGKNWRPIALAGAAIDTTCKQSTMAVLRSWLQDVDVKNATTEDLLIITGDLKEMDPDNVKETARLLRSAAMKIAAEDRFRAEEIAKHLHEIDPSIMNEIETKSLMKASGPIEVKADVSSAPSEESAPLSRIEATKRTLTDLGEAVIRYRGSHNNQYPRAETIEALWTQVRAYATRVVDTYDGWAMPIRYVSDGRNARLVSSGFDAEFEASSLDLAVPVAKSQVPGADVVWENGRIVREPMELDKQTQNWQR